jgi:hypothetical protein
MDLAKSSLNIIIRSLWESIRCRDTLLLVATYFHAQLYKNISSFISNATHIPNIELGMELYESIRPLLVEELIPIDVLAREILKISPRPIRSGENWFALQCVYRMLQSRLFRRHDVDASDWVFKQIQCCNDTDPLPATIADIIVEFVSK